MTVVAIAKLTNHLLFEIDFQKLDQHTGDKWLIHGTKHRRTISWKAWNSHVEYRNWEHKFHMKDSDGNMLNPVF